MDGECTFCQSSVQFIMKRDRGAFYFASLQSKIGQSYVEKFNLTHIDSVILIEDEKAYIYSDAALRIARQLENPWRLISIAKIVPKIIRDTVYKFIAKNRHYIIREQPVCLVPSEKDRSRFLM